MYRGRFTFATALIILVLITIMFAMIGTGRPPDNTLHIPAQANGSLNKTLANEYIVKVNAINVTQTAVTSDISPGINDPHGSALMLEILKLNNISWGYESYYYNTYDVLVLRSNDTAYKEGSNHTMIINEEMAGYFGMTSGIAPKELTPGIIIEISNYGRFDGNLSVTVSADPYNQTAWDNAWKQKIAIIGTNNGM